MSPRANIRRLPIDTPALSALLQVLYQSASRPAELSGFLERCCWHIDATAGAIAVCETRTGLWRYAVRYPGNNPGIQRYAQLYVGNDPISTAVLGAAPRKFHQLRELISAAELAASTYFTEWYASLGYDDLLLMHIPMSEELSLLVGFVREMGKPHYASEERALLETLVPHIEQTVVLHNTLDRLGVFADIAQEQLLQAGEGLVVLDSDSHALHMNRVAVRMLRETGAIGMVDGRFRIEDPQLRSRFDQLVSQCMAVSGSQSMLAGGLVAIPRTEATPLLLAVMPYRRQRVVETLMANGGRVVLTLFDPDRAHTDTRRQLREMYKLSEAEAEVCWRIGNGDTVQEIASATGSTRETVRSQIKRVFAKTGTNRQPDLVRIVLLGPAAWRRSLAAHRQS